MDGIRGEGMAPGPMAQLGSCWRYLVVCLAEGGGIIAYYLSIKTAVTIAPFRDEGQVQLSNPGHHGRFPSSFCCRFVSILF